MAMWSNWWHRNWTEEFAYEFLDSSPNGEPPAPERPVAAGIMIFAVLAMGWIFVGRPFLQHRRVWELGRAAYDGDMAAVRRVVEAGVEVNATPTDWGGAGKGVPALTVATLTGHENVVRYLLDHGANANLKGMNNPLILACWKRHARIAQMLLEHGADPNVHGEGTPLYAAEGTDQKDLAVLLRRYGARE